MLNIAYSLKLLSKLYKKICPFLIKKKVAIVHKDPTLYHFIVFSEKQIYLKQLLMVIVVYYRRAYLKLRQEPTNTIEVAIRQVITL